MDISIRCFNVGDRQQWFSMRKGVWPEAPDEYLNFDMDEIMASDKDIVFFAYVNEKPAGMIEVRLRDYAEACETSPIGYIEGWFVYPEFRGSGVAGALTQAAENWAREKGCTEMASDTWLDNEASIRAHAKLGYEEAERLVHFVKQI